MKCPVCGEHSPAAWKSFQVPAYVGATHAIRSGADDDGEISVDWMHCANEECKEAVVRIHETTTRYVQHVPLRDTDTWVARPRFGESLRPVDPLVPPSYRRDYLESAAILDTSHRMSAVLARRILGDLLREYGGQDHRRLDRQIDDFVEDAHPSRLTESLHHFREVGNFGAHTQAAREAGDGELPEIIDVDRDEAEWTLDLVDRLFDYFIVQPARDKAFRKSIDEKIERAGRRPLEQGKEDESASS